MRRKGLILGMVLMLFGFLKVNVASGCEGVMMGPRINSVIYLRTIADAYGIHINYYLGQQNFGAPIESLAYIKYPKKFGDIVNEIESTFRGGIYNLDRIIAEVNYLLDEYKEDIEKEIREKQGKEIELNVGEIRSKLEADLKEWGVYDFVDEFLNALGVNPDTPVKDYTRQGVYPVLQDPKWSGAGNLHRGSMAYKEKKITGNTVKGVITDWMIAMELSGYSPNDLAMIIEDGFVRYVEKSKNGEKKIKFKNEEGEEIEWSVMDAIKHYLGGKFEPTNPEHLRAFVNLCSELYLGESYVPQDLIEGGWGYLVDNAEAYYMKEFFKTGSKVNPKTGKRETVLLKGGDGEEIGEDYYNYWGHRIYMMRKVLDKLNATNYYYRKLSLSDSFDAGLVSAFVDRYYAMIRDICYNPVSQSWNVKDEKERANIRKEALDRLINYIDLGPKLIPVLDKVLEKDYDITGVDLTGHSYEAEFSRRKLSQWSEIAYMLETYGGMNADDAVNAVKGIIPVAGLEKEGIGTNRNKIIDLIKKYYANFGYGEDMTGFLDEDPSKWEETTKRLYNGMVFTVCNMLKWKDMFKITEKGIDGGIKALSEMFEKSKEAGLPEMLVKDYLGGEGLNRKEHLESGRYSGKLMFWQQVLYAYYKKTGDLEKAKEYVKYQLKARELIRKALGADVLGWDSDLTAFEAFENKLEADLSNLSEVLEKVNNVEDKIEWSDVPNLAGILATPQTRLWPVLPSEGSEFQFPQISEDTKSYIDAQLARFGYQPEEDTGFATVPPKEPVATLDLPLL